MENAFERTYWANDVAETLGISTSALRKWSLRLEAEGYRFIRDEHDRRAYRESDLVALRKMKEFLGAKMSLENAAKTVSVMYSERSDTTPVTSIVPTDERRSEERLQVLETKMDELIELNKQLVQQLHQRDETDRERYARFDHLLSEVTETRRMLAAAEEQPEKKWWQFWKS
ncbi:MerR family transcriptional regulator [Brevibacillus borstelensis]|uniref:MerR family transcriptional regulator n=1 Tax=Brevibacillus borstelensis TaxID=45462 RepID=UPI002041D079|nr:MerR family transcriptional regulator [Brevibacillus borstelensis]MCM3593636.1 MerR family transcriptional regulator [Brevibacillus borstelensis]